MIKIISMPYPHSHFDKPAKLAHEDIPLESLVEWFTPPEGLQLTHVDVDEALTKLRIHHHWPSNGTYLLNAIEIHMGREHPYLGHDPQAVHVATIFFANSDEFRICTPMRSNEALERITLIAGNYIASLSKWMRDPVEDDEVDFLKGTQDRIGPISPVDHIRQASISSLGA